jgi:MFS transporter, DHA1 family, multidrug resistance protein
LLAAFGALGQFGSNVFLPGLPQIGLEYQASDSASAASYSVYLAVFGFTQLVAGPLTDRFGRRPIALWSLVIFCVGSLACALAPSLASLIAARVLQAIGAAGAIVVSRSVCRDLYSGAELVKVTTTIMLAFALVPGLAPLLGGVLVDSLGWRSTMWVSAALGALIGLWIYLALIETLPKDRRTRHSVIGAYGAVLRNPVYLRMVLIGGIAFGGLLAFFGGSPRLYIGVLKLSAQEFGIYPPIALLGFFVGAAFLRRFNQAMSVKRLLLIGVSIQVFACLIMLIPLAAGWLSLWPLNTGIVLFVVGLGLISPLSFATAMHSQPSFAGQASGLIGFMQMVFGAIGAVLANWISDLSPTLGMQAAMLLLAVLNLLLVASLRSDIGSRAAEGRSG